jgi:predicted PurR-regulated permease PerM
VAVGVLGIAVIQGLLAGIGMMLADVPAAGLIAIIVLVFAIAQLPPILVLAPVIFYVFSASSTTVAVIFLIWCLLVSFSDVVLKPLLLGRGVDVPMLVILMGAIGGMITSGIVGLFVGAVILALGFTLFQAWIQMAEPESNVPSTEPES